MSGINKDDHRKMRMESWSIVPAAAADAASAALVPSNYLSYLRGKRSSGADRTFN